MTHPPRDITPATCAALEDCSLDARNSVPSAGNPTEGFTVTRALKAISTRGSTSA